MVLADADFQAKAHLAGREDHVNLAIEEEEIEEPKPEDDPARSSCSRRG